VDTQKGSAGLFRFITLTPHRDALLPLHEYREKLFSSGFLGAHSFPLAAPLIAVSRPFSRDELKELSKNIRHLTKENDGKIVSLGISQANFGNKFAFFGQSLSLRIEESIFPETAKAKILHIFNSPVLCANCAQNFVPLCLSERSFPALSFRAASLANMTMRSLDYGEPGYSFEWRIGPPVWLPKYKTGS